MKTINLMIVLIAVHALISAMAHGQGTLYFSSLSQQPSASIAVGSDAWLGQGFLAGTNGSVGYVLNSIELGMNVAFGSPSGFTLSLYQPSPVASYLPGAKISDLTGPEPIGAGVYTFGASGEVLLPSTVYFLVLSSLTPVASGSYSVAVASDTSSWISVGGWQPVYQPGSADGSIWVRETHQPIQFSLNATPVPEPSSLASLGCGALLLFSRFLWRGLETRKS